MKAIVTSPICPLMTRPSHQCRRGDEALFGMTLEVLEDTRTGWYQVEAPYRYGGYAPAECLLFGDSGVRRLTRGALVSPVGAPDERGWQRVVLPDGREGYTKCSFLCEYYKKPFPAEENAFRAAVTATARSYLGVHYRWLSLIHI